MADPWDKPGRSGAGLDGAGANLERMQAFIRVRMTQRQRRGEERGSYLFFLRRPLFWSPGRLVSGDLTHAFFDST
jgi:hypothetical protein